MKTLQAVFSSMPLETNQILMKKRSVYKTRFLGVYVFYMGPQDLRPCQTTKPVTLTLIYFHYAIKFCRIIVTFCVQCCFTPNIPYLKI